MEKGRRAERQGERGEGRNRRVGSEEVGRRERQKIPLREKRKMKGLNLEAEDELASEDRVGGEWAWFVST